MKTILVAALILSAIGINPVVHAGVITGKVQVPGKDNIENIIIYIENTNGNFTPPKERPQMNHINLQFVPRTLGVMAGTTVDFPNSDPVFHSGFSISKSNPFDLGIYGKGKEKFVTFKNPGLVEIFCHIHSHMHAFVLVLETPYFGHTSENGSFTIRDVPSGTYSIKAWMDPTFNQTKTITVKDSGSVSVNFTLTSQN